MSHIFSEALQVGEDLLETIITEAKALASSAADFLKDAAISTAQKAVALIKETSLGTAIANLISAASASDATGAEKFAAVLAAVEKAYAAFVDNGGLSGLISTGLSVLRQAIQSLYDDFAATFLGATAA